MILSKSGRFSKANTYLFGEVSLDGGSGCGSVGRAVLLIPEVCSSNPVIGNIYIERDCQLHCKDENKEIEPGNGPFLEKESGNGSF